MIKPILESQVSSAPDNRHSRESGKPDFQHIHLRKIWIPAFAGMTAVRDEQDDWGQMARRTFSLNSSVLSPE